MTSIPQEIPPALALRSFVVEEIKWETPSIYTLVLVPREGESMFSFKPGQWVYLQLLNSDGTPLKRAAFSIASAPEESKTKIELCIKKHGECTTRGADLIPGDLVQIQGPFGVFTLPEGNEPLVFFAGGIGITPLRSMIRSLALQQANQEVILFYSNKSIEEFAFFDEFNRLAESWPHLRLIYFLTQESPDRWKDPTWNPSALLNPEAIKTPRKWIGETGRLNKEIIQKYVSDLSAPTFLICGPRSFMESVEETLSSFGVDTKARLKREMFG